MKKLITTSAALLALASTSAFASITCSDWEDLRAEEQNYSDYSLTVGVTGKNMLITKSIDTKLVDSSSFVLTGFVNTKKFMTIDGIKGSKKVAFSINFTTGVALINTFVYKTAKHQKLVLVSMLESQFCKGN
ncbi:MAG: hypothetical protein GXP18_07345 [Gammaproteobacteria bacterium]|nr:hypothetical protein [Gammaproteobacteria bacterium]